MVHKFSILRQKVNLLMQGNSPLTEGCDKFEAKTSLEAQLAYPYTACHFRNILYYKNNCMIPRYSSTELLRDNYGYPLCTHPHHDTKNHHHGSRVDANIRAIGVSAICIPSTILTTTALVFIEAIFPVTLVSRNTLTAERTRCVRATCFHTALSHPFLALVDICEGIKYVNYPSHPKIEY